jgi:hypothetical protein
MTEATAAHLGKSNQHDTALPTPVISTAINKMDCSTGESGTADKAPDMPAITAN